MIALYIAAAGIVAVAVALLVARTPAKLRTADQRGITLQTLIVTAVLVLMAGAAGVVIIAITNNAQDNLEGQDVGIDSRCEPWEIFDPTLDAAGRGGGQGGIDSSASGCVRVCYIQFAGTAAWVTPTADGTLRTTGTGGNQINLGAAIASPAHDASELVFSRSSIFDDTYTAGTGADPNITLPVNGQRTVDSNGDGEDGFSMNPQRINGTDTVDNYEIQVAPNGRYCRVWNYTDDEELTALRSN